MDELKEAIRMYSKLRYLYKTTDDTIHTSPEGARAQALHLPAKTIQKITCKTGKTILIQS